VRIRQIREGHRGRIKMPEHASCESFIKTLKREEIHREQVHRPGRTSEHRRLHRAVLQAEALAFYARRKAEILEENLPRNTKARRDIHRSVRLS
jgi:hypothetical protein